MTTKARASFLIAQHINAGGRVDRYTFAEVEAGTVVVTEPDWGDRPVFVTEAPSVIEAAQGTFSALSIGEGGSRFECSGIDVHELIAALRVPSDCEPLDEGDDIDRDELIQAMLPDGHRLVPWQIFVRDVTRGQVVDLTVKVIEAGDERHLVAWPEDFEELQPVWSQKLLEWWTSSENDLAISSQSVTIGLLGDGTLGEFQAGDEAADHQLWLEAIRPDLVARRVAHLIDSNGWTPLFLRSVMGFRRAESDDQEEHGEGMSWLAKHALRGEVLKHLEAFSGDAKETS